MLALTREFFRAAKKLSCLLKVEKIRIIGHIDNISNTTNKNVISSINNWLS
jgi:hypothetical protein